MILRLDDMNSFFIKGIILCCHFLLNKKVAYMILLFIYMKTEKVKIRLFFML